MKKPEPYAKLNGARYKIQWTSKTKRVDIETGEEITENTMKREYIKIITKNKITYNANKTKGHIEYTIECRRQPQLNLF